MPTPGEHKTVQARILAYAEAIHLRQGYGGQVGWTIVSREDAEERRGGIPAPLSGKVGDRNVPAPLSLFFDDLLDAEVREFPVRRGFNRRDRKEDLDFLSSLCSLRLVRSATTCCSIQTSSELS
jgi:hypothetical protein